MKNVPHVGGILREEIMGALGLSVTATAKLLGVTRVTVSRLAHEHVGLSAEMALRIERVFGWSAATLLRWQVSYDLEHAQPRVNLSKLTRYRGRWRAKIEAGLRDVEAGRVVGPEALRRHLTDAAKKIGKRKPEKSALHETIVDALESVQRGEGLDGDAVFAEIKRRRAQIEEGWQSAQRGEFVDGPTSMAEGRRRLKALVKTKKRRNT
jgi:addiction module HigA family antidote